MYDRKYTVAGFHLERAFVNEKRVAMFCRNCGKELPKDSRFCPYCGTRTLANDGKSHLNIDFPINQKGTRQNISGKHILSIGYFILSVVPFLFMFVMMAVQDIIADPHLANHMLDLVICYVVGVAFIVAHIKLSHHLIEKQNSGEYHIPFPILMKVNDKLFSFYLVLAIAFGTFCSIGGYSRTGNFSEIVGYWVAGFTLIAARYYYRKLVKKSVTGRSNDA